MTMVQGQGGPPALIPGFCLEGKSFNVYCYYYTIPTYCCQPSIKDSHKFLNAYLHSIAIYIKTRGESKTHRPADS